MVLPVVLGFLVNKCPLNFSLFFGVCFGYMFCCRLRVLTVWDANAEMSQKNSEKFSWLVFLPLAPLLRLACEPWTARSLTGLTCSGQLARTRARASHLWGPANNVPGLPFTQCCLGSLARARTVNFAFVVFSIGIKHCFSRLLHIIIQCIAHCDIVSSVCLLRSS